MINHVHELIMKISVFTALKNFKHRRSYRDRYPLSKFDKTNSFQITTIDCTRVSNCICSRYHVYQSNNDLAHVRLSTATYSSHQLYTQQLTLFLVVILAELAGLLAIAERVVKVHPAFFIVRLLRTILVFVHTIRAWSETIFTFKQSTTLLGNILT